MPEIENQIPKQNEAKGTSIWKVVIIGGIIDLVLGIPLISTFIGGVVAGYLSKRKRMLEAAAVGIGAGLLSAIIAFVLVFSTPSIIFSIAGSGGSVSSTAHTQLLGIVNNIQAILGVIALANFIFAFITGSIGGAVGFWLADRNSKKSP